VRLLALLANIKVVPFIILPTKFRLGQKGFSFFDLLISDDENVL